MLINRIYLLPTLDKYRLIPMGLKYKPSYNELTDKQIVEKILSEPHDEEAAAYLLYNRYHFLLLKTYCELTNNNASFGDCVQDLFIHLRGKDNSWHNLETFEWRSTFGYWLKGVAWNKFQDVLDKMIENKASQTSIDNNNPEKPTIQIPGENGEETLYQRERRVVLMEAIRQLKDDDQRFVILKRLQGYSSKEIATLLQKKWQKYGIKKYNKKQELIVPSVGYVNVRVERAKEELKKMLEPYK